MQAILTLSNGDLEQLRHYSEVASVDYRDVLLWAETSRQEYEPSTYKELRERFSAPIAANFRVTVLPGSE